MDQRAQFREVSRSHEPSKMQRTGSVTEATVFKKSSLYLRPQDSIFRVSAFVDPTRKES